MSDAEAKEAWADAWADHFQHELTGPEISCPWCHGDDPTWADYLELDGPFDAQEG